MTPRLPLVALLAASLSTSAAAQVKPCVTPAEAETLALVAMPAILGEAGRLCTATLPRGAFLRGRSRPLVAKYQVEADRAWPAARTALAKFVAPELAPLLQTDLARPMLTTLLLAQLLGRVDVRDCGTIDRMASLLQPLPPRSTAGLIVAALQYLKGQKALKNPAVKAAPDLPICDGAKP